MRDRDLTQCRAARSSLGPPDKTRGEPAHRRGRGRSSYGGTNNAPWSTEASADARSLPHSRTSILFGASDKSRWRAYVSFRISCERIDSRGPQYGSSDRGFENRNFVFVLREGSGSFQSDVRGMLGRFRSHGPADQPKLFPPRSTAKEWGRPAPMTRLPLSALRTAAANSSSWWPRHRRAL